MFRAARAAKHVFLYCFQEYRDFLNKYCSHQVRLQGGEVLLLPKILVRPKPIWKFQKISNSAVGGSLWKSLVESSDVSLRAKTRRSNWKLPRLQGTENFKSVKNSPGAAALDAVSWRLTYSSGCDRLTTTWMTSWFEVQSFPTTCKLGQSNAMRCSFIVDWTILWPIHWWLYCW